MAQYKQTTFWERLFGQRREEVGAVGDTPKQPEAEPTFEWDPAKVVLPGIYRCCPIIQVEPTYSRASGRPMVKITVEVQQGDQLIGPAKIYMTLQRYASLLDGLAIVRTPDLNVTLGRWVNVEVTQHSGPGSFGGTSINIVGPLL